jgi:BCD family chlorophyll transporter-like MFS transporter
MLISALVFGYLLRDFSPGKLIQVIQGSALTSVVLNVIAIWKQETRHSRGTQPQPQEADFFQTFSAYCATANARRQLAVVGIGTLAFGMAELILEPFGGQVLSMSVSGTTKLTALLALGGLIGFAYASHILARGQSAYRVTRNGAAIGIPGFMLVVLSVPADSTQLFLIGNFLIGFGGALFGHGTLTATMDSAPPDKTGMALGAWGAMQATAAGLGIALSGTLRDIIHHLSGGDPTTGYFAVYAIELMLLVLALIVAAPLLKQAQKPVQQNVSVAQ